MKDQIRNEREVINNDEAAAEDAKDNMKDMDDD